jgi:hypothetical protein
MNDIQFNLKFDRYLSFDRAEFPFLPNNATSKQAAYDKMMDYSRKAITALEQHAGRKLSPTELVHGVADHPENRTPSQIVADAQPDPQPHFPGTENPYQRALDMGLGNPNHKETREEMYRRKAAEWEVKRQTDAEKAAFDADPKRQRAVEHAKRELDGLKFDPSATVEEIEMAETRLHVARHESLDEYREMDRFWRQTKQRKLDEATAQVDEKIRSLKAQRQEIESRHFDPPAPPVPETLKPRYEKISIDSPEWEEFADSKQREARARSSQSPAIG